MLTIKARGFILLLALSVLSACAPLTMQVGVPLQAVPFLPTPTPTPVPVAQDVAGRFSMEFLGVSAGFEYPASWTVHEGQQYVMAFDAERGGLWPSLNMAITRASSDRTAYPLLVAANDYMVTWDDWRNQYFLITEYYRSIQNLLDTERNMPFGWGGHEAAMRTVQIHYQQGGVDETLIRFQVSLKIDDRNDFLTIWAIVPQRDWEAFQPTLRGMLESLTLNNEPLPSRDVISAFAML